MKKLPLMKCGCAAQAVDSDSGAPYCLTHDCTEVEEGEVDLSGRRARCSYYGTNSKYAKPCRAEGDSSLNLAFFEYKPDAEYDTYYCGCWGWD